MIRKGEATIFDFGEWASEMATRINPDGTISFITIVPGFKALEFVVGQRTLLRRARRITVAITGSERTG